MCPLCQNGREDLEKLTGRFHVNLSKSAVFVYFFNSSHENWLHERPANQKISMDEQLIQRFCGWPANQKIFVDDWLLKIFIQTELLCKFQSHNNIGHNSTYSVSE
jgi:hypothetical protein